MFTISNNGACKRFFQGVAFSALILSLSPSVMAGEDGSPFEGLYIGAKMTSMVTTSSFSHKLLADVADDYDPLFDDLASTSSSRGFAGGFYAGLGMTSGMFYAGVEAGFEVSRGRFNVLDDSVNTSTEEGVDNSNGPFGLYPRNIFSVAARGGVLLGNNALVYGLVGYESHGMKEFGIPDLTDSDKTRAEGFGGLRFGAGFEYLIMENVAFRAEYTQTKFGSKTFISGSDQFTYKPTTKMLSISLVLHMY